MRWDKKFHMNERSEWMLEFLFIMEETQQQQTQIATGWTAKIQRLYQEYKRVLLVTKKPTKEEFITIVKVSGLGILVIGLLGFIIQMVELMLFK